MAPLGQAKSLVFNECSPLEKTGLPVRSRSCPNCEGPGECPEVGPKLAAGAAYGLWKAFADPRAVRESPRCCPSWRAENLIWTSVLRHRSTEVWLKRMARRSDKRDHRSPGRGPTRVSTRGTAIAGPRLQALQARLSPREYNLATLVAEGRRDKEIATTLSITERTVRLHWNHVCQKLGIASRDELRLMLGTTDKDAAAVE